MIIRLDFNEQLNFDLFKKQIDKILQIKSFEIDLYISKEYRLKIDNNCAYIKSEQDSSKLVPDPSYNLTLLELVNNNWMMLYKPDNHEYIKNINIIVKYFESNARAIFRIGEDKEASRKFIAELIFDICIKLFDISKNKIFL